MNKTKWYTRPVYLLVALAVVVSLGVGGAVSQPNPPQVSANPGSESLMVDIVKVINATGVEKNPPYTFAVDECFLVNAAVAYKNIGGSGSVSVSATIDPGVNATLGSGEVDTKALGSIASNNVTDVWWRVCCEGVGSTIITVTANSTSLSGSASITVTQGEPLPDVLVVELIECPGNVTTLHKSDDFVIKARVNNTQSSGGIVATDVWGIISGYTAANASLSAGNPDRWELGDIWPGESAEVMWNLHCDGPGQGLVTIGATASNLNPEQITEAECYVDQGLPGPVTVTVDVKPKVCSSPCCFPLNKFTVNAIFCNNYGENATNVTATINITGNATLVFGEQETHTLENWTGGSGINTGNCSNITTWNVSCTDEGPVIFTVTTAADQAWAAESGTATTIQQDYTLNIMDVTNPKGQTLNYPHLTGNTTTVETCQNFTVNASFQNCLDEMLNDVNFTIALPTGSVELKPYSVVHVVMTELDGTEIENYNVTPADTSVILATLCSCCHVNLTWELHCLGSSEGVAENITVSAYESGELLDSDYFKVIQVEKAHLAAGIEVYPGKYTDDTLVTTAVDGLYVGQNFTIAIPVFNLGEASATNVSVNYTITGNTSCAGANGTAKDYTSANISVLEGRTAGKILQECWCSGETDLNITINYINGTDSITDEEIIDANKFIPAVNTTIMQIPFDVVIIQPEGGAPFNCSDEFAVKINITNNSTDEWNIVTGVNAKLTWTGGAEFVDAANQSATIDVGNITPGSNPQEAAWLMHCTGAGRVNFTVTVTAESPLMNIVETVYVTQNPTTTLNVEILSPEHADDTPTYVTCEQFAVTAKVSNNGTRPSAAVTVTITPGTYAQVVSGSNPVIIAGGLAPGASQIVSWTLHAYKAGAACGIVGNTITVTATALCAAPHSDSVNVDIYPAAHLVVAASAPSPVEVGSDFNVTVTVTNTGWADASQVKLRIDTGDNSALTPGEKLTKTIGTLIGFGQSSSAAVIWTLQCEGAGKSTIIITPEGYDECGWYTTENSAGVLVWENQPGKAINPAFLEPDSVTVEQKTIVPGDEVTTIGIATGLNFVSAPKKLENSTFTDFVSDINYSIAYEFDPTNATQPFQPIFDPINTTVNVLDGYWINANEPGTITLTYRTGLMLPPSKDLTGKKWNAIGFSSASETGLPAVATLKSVGDTWSTLIGWDTTGQSYEGAIISGVNDDERMYPGKGYWLWVTADDTLAGVGA